MTVRPHDQNCAACDLAEFSGVTYESTHTRSPRSGYIQRLVDLLNESKRVHRHCDDSFYCCARCQHSDHGDRAFIGDGDMVCDCGADTWNKRVEDAVNGLDD